jgi:hypothetical protein
VDVATARLSEIKRLRIGHRLDSLTTSDRRRLHFLKEGHSKFFRSRQEGFNFSRFDKALELCLRSWAGGKTLTDIRRSVADSPPDWHPDFTRLFLKSQVVKKLSKRGRAASAGQTVATFPKPRVFEDAVWATYFSSVAEEWRLPTTYLHDRPITDMLTWYRRYWSPGPITASDYTAWDSSCDHVFAHFNAWLLHRAGVPNDYIDGFLSRKFNTRSYLGPMLPMQFSGDRWTWTMNTHGNAALTGHSFDCPSGTPAAFSGDDMTLLGNWENSANFKSSSWLMAPKLERGSYLDFCGFTFGGSSPYVSPDVLLYRATVALQSGRTDASFWDSFDLACRYSDPNLPTSTLASALQVSKDVRSLYNLPPSPFPNG